MATTSCPDACRLEEHLEGTLAKAAEAEVGAHLNTCADCQQTLIELAGGSGPLLAIARQVGAEPPAPAPALQGALQELLEQEPAPAAEVDGGVFALLSPPRVPGHLGRLGPYEILEVLGRGGMGIVLKAHDEKLHRAVAIKVMAPQLAANASARKRFLREARAAAAVRNQHVVDIHAVEQANGLPFLVMECLDGVSLQERLDSDAPLPWVEIVRVGREL